MTALARAGNGDRRVIGLVGSSHFLSHYLIYLLPPILPLLKADFGVGYAALGLAMTTFNVASGLTHAPMGFLVDRVGARRLLLVGIAVGACAYIGMGVFANYIALLVFAALAGVANSVYHPADYAILSASVSGGRMGRAFSLHTFAGFSGGAVAPLVMAFASATWGWRTGLILSGGLCLAVWTLLWWNRQYLDDGGRRLSERPAEAGAGRATAAASGIALLLSLPILMCFLFFVMLSMSQGGLSTFAVAAFVAIHDITLEGAQMALTAFLVGSALGVLAGGQIADRTRHHEWVAVVGFLATAVIVFAVGNLHLNGFQVAAAMTVAGVMFGVIMPSRDMLVRAVTPEGSMGKVFGFVSTGLNLGGAITPALFGWLMDQGEPRLLFWFAPLFMLIAVVTVLAARFTRPAATLAENR